MGRIDLYHKVILQRYYQDTKSIASEIPSIVLGGPFFRGTLWRHQKMSEKGLTKPKEGGSLIVSKKVERGPSALEWFFISCRGFGCVQNDILFFRKRRQ